MFEYLKKLNKDFAVALVGLFFGLLSLNVLAETNLITGYNYFVLWVVLGVTFLVLYCIRFKRKAQVDWMDYIKLFSVFLAPFIPILSSYFDFEPLELLGIAGFIYIPFLISIYATDRFIIKPEPMKKRIVIVLIVESLIVLLSLAYAYVQTVKAQHSEREAQSLMNNLLKQRQNSKKEIETLSAEIKKLKSEKVK